MMTDAPSGSVPSAPSLAAAAKLNEIILARVNEVETLIPSMESFRDYVTNFCSETRSWQATFIKVTDEVKQLRNGLQAKELLCGSLSKEVEETKATIHKLAKEFHISHEKIRSVMERSAEEESLASMSLSVADSSYVSTDISLGSSVYSTLASSADLSDTYSTTTPSELQAAKPDDVVSYWRKELSRLQDRLDGVVEVNKNWKKEFTEMEQKKNAKIAELESRNRHLEESGDISDDVRRASIAAEAKASNAERERDEACRELHATKAQLANVLLELEGSRQQLNSVLDRHEQEERTNTENIERLKQKMRDTSAARRQMEVELRSAQNELETLRRQNRSYEYKLSHLRKGLHSLMFQEEPAQSGRQPRETAGRKGQKSTPSAHAKGSVGLVPRGGAQNFQLPSDVTIDEERED